MNLKWMNKILLLIVIIINILSFNVIAVEQYESNYIIDNSKDLDGQTIIYQGEAVGDIMYRNDNYGWINVNDGKMAIGIWAKKEDLQKITYVGEYNVKGDIIKITGKVNYICDEHGGDLDIHADNIEIIQLGEKIKDIPDPRLSLILRALLIPTGIILAVVLVENTKKKKEE